MIDPDSIQIQRGNLPDKINIENVPEFESQIYNLEDDKEYKKYIKDVERQVRTSFEYRRFTRFLRNNFGMNKCAVLEGVSNADTYDIKIEIHHYPFSLYDIIETVVAKRNYYKESLDIQMVAKEATQLHYKCLIGLISLSETAHQLAHNNRLFIPVDKVFGRYQLFVDYYKPFCGDALLECLERIEKYTNEHTEVNDTTILNYNPVEFHITDSSYVLPDLNTVKNQMNHQLEMIKENNYILPTKQEAQLIVDKKNETTLYSPIIFHEEPVNISIPPVRKDIEVTYKLHQPIIFHE